MRTRAYRPEVNRLEGRSPLSGVAGLSAAGPVAVSPRRLHLYAEQVRQTFLLYARGAYYAPQVRDDLYQVAVMIPFGRVDGLGVTINRIVDEMQQDVFAHVPNAVLSARNDVLASTRAFVDGRVEAGDVVVR